MAEHFRGHGYTVQLSTAATRELYRSLVSLGAREPQTPPREATLRFLKGRLEGEGEREIGFDLAPPPAELDDSARLAYLARLLAGLARQLAAPEPGDGASGGSAERQVQLDLLARVLDLRLLVLEAGAATNVAPEPDLPLTERDRREVELRRLLGRKQHLLRHTRSSDNPRGDVRLVEPQHILPLLERILALAAHIEPEARRRRVLAEQHFDRGTALARRGDHAAAAESFRRAASAETDEELRRSLLEYADELERSS